MIISIALLGFGALLLAPRLADRAQSDVRALQIVFQNPAQALNRRHTVRRILRRPRREVGR